MSSMVTGDAVVLDVQVAQLPVRALSALIDITAMFICYLVGTVLTMATIFRFDTALTTGIMITFIVVIFVGYPVIFETTTRGRSLGKMAMGLRVVSDDGGPERVRQAVFRALAGVVEIWLLTGGPAVICSLLSRHGKRLGDLFAGTIVISERSVRPAPPLLMPPPLACWAASLQLSALRPETAESARQFLSRERHLDAQLRDAMAYRIAGVVARQISPPPPPGAPPRLVLAAVVAERHRRELARLQRQSIPSPPLPVPLPPTQSPGGGGGFALPG